MAYMGEKRVKGVGMKTHMNEALERYRHRRKDNIKTDLKETGWDGVDWIYLAQDRNKYRALVNMVITFMVHKM